MGNEKKIFFTSDTNEPRTVHGDGSQEIGVETSTVPCHDSLTSHGSIQGESSDAASIYTASTSVSGYGKLFIDLYSHYFN